MATAAQVFANRENAKHSTGPTTEAGKEISSRNRTAHGLTGHAFFFMEGEDPAEFERLHEALKREHSPQTVTERILVEKMAQAHWLSQRALSIQTYILAKNPLNDEALKRANTYVRYQTQQDRLFARALKDLLTLRAERRKEEIGFESKKRVEADQTRKAEIHTLKMDILGAKLQRELTRIPSPVAPSPHPISEPIRH